MKNDPTRDEMLTFLFAQGVEDFDAEAAIYVFAERNHGGQWSNLYSALSTSHFSPGPIWKIENDESAFDAYQSLEAEFNPKVCPPQYLHVRECRSREEWVIPIAEDTPLNLKALVAEWVENEYSGEMALDGELTPGLDGDYYARIILDGRAPDSVVCWTGGGFYLSPA